MPNTPYKSKGVGGTLLSELHGYTFCRCENTETAHGMQQLPPVILDNEEEDQSTGEGRAVRMREMNRTSKGL
jgi:hypothetical protein